MGVVCRERWKKAELMTSSLAEMYNGGVGNFHSDTDEPIDHGGSEDEAEGASGKEDEDLDPLLVKEEILSYLDDLEAMENGDSDEERQEIGKKYHHLLWRSRCWKVSGSRVIGGRGL